MLQSKKLFSDHGPERGDLPDGYKAPHIEDEKIVFDSVSPRDAGEYVCKGTNPAGSATDKIVLRGEW